MEIAQSSHFCPGFQQRLDGGTGIAHCRWCIPPQNRSFVDEFAMACIQGLILGTNGNSLLIVQTQTAPSDI